MEPSESSGLSKEIISFMARQDEINKTTSSAIKEMVSLHKQNGQMLVAMNTKQENCLLAQQARNDPNKRANRIAIASIAVAALAFVAPPAFRWIKTGQEAIKQQKVLMMIDHAKKNETNREG